MHFLTQFGCTLDEPDTSRAEIFFKETSQFCFGTAPMLFCTTFQSLHDVERNVPHKQLRHYTIS